MTARRALAKHLKYRFRLTTAQILAALASVASVNPLQSRGDFTACCIKVAKYSTECTSLEDEGTSAEELQSQLRLGASAVYSEPEKDWARLDARRHMGADSAGLPDDFHRRHSGGFLKVLI